MKKQLVAAVTLAMGLGVGAAHAALLPISSTLTTPETQWSDDDAEILVDRDGDGKISEGDWLVGVLQITSYPVLPTLQQPASLYNSFSAFFATEVKNDPILISDLPGLSDAQKIALSGTTCGAGPLLPSCAVFDFQPISSGAGGLQEALDYLTSEGITIPGFLNPDTLSFGASSVTAFFEDTTTQTSVDREQDIQSGITNAMDGTLRMVLELNSPDEWSAGGPQDIADFLLRDPGEFGGSFNTTLTISGHGFGDRINVGDKVAVTGSLYRPASDSIIPQFPGDERVLGATGWAVNSDATFTFPTNAVPEPASLALVGLGLLGMGATVRRRSKK